jgi:Glycosyl hydrolase family 79 C-terminal beta domain
MWSVDYTLSLAIRNYSAIYIHTREQNISYNIFDPPTSSVSSWTTGPQYYSLLLLAEALRGTDPSTGLSVVADLGLTDSSGSSVAGYVIYDGKGTNPQRLVLLNFGDASFGTTPNVSFAIPAGLSPQGKDGTFIVKFLSAPSLSEETAIQWAGQSVDGSGNLQGTVVENKVQCKAGCNIDVPGPAVALVALTNSSVLGKSGSGFTCASIVALCVVLFTLCFGHLEM